MIISYLDLRTEELVINSIKVPHSEPRPPFLRPISKDNISSPKRLSIHFTESNIVYDSSYAKLLAVKRDDLQRNSKYSPDILPNNYPIE